MEIIIVGCGKVGSFLARELSEEGHNIVVVDTRADRVEESALESDTLGCIGIAISHDTLLEAGVEKADLLIAVTGNDEVNLLCCLLAKRAGRCATIARVRNPEYQDALTFLGRVLDLAMVVNPEQSAAEEIFRVLHFPTAINVDTFSRGSSEILKFRIKDNSPLNGMPVRDVVSILHANILVCVVERGDEVFIPDGDFVLQNRDLVSIAGTLKDSLAFFEQIGIKTNTVRDIIIIGASKIAFYLAKMLEKSGIHVTIIEKDLDACNNIAEKLPFVNVIHGDGSDQKLLLEEGLANVDAFAALTGLDEENVFLSMYAKSKARMKTITKINRIGFDEVISDLDLDTIINPKKLTAQNTLRYARTMANTVGSNVETLHRLAQDRVEALEFVIRDQSPVNNIPLSRLNLKSGVLIALIEREGRVFIPRGSDFIQPGDRVIVITDRSGMCDVQDILGSRGGLQR